MSSQTTAEGRTGSSIGRIHVAERWRDGVKTFMAWWSNAPGRVGYGITRADAIRGIPRAAAKTGEVRS